MTGLWIIRLCSVGLPEAGSGVADDIGPCQAATPSFPVVCGLSGWLWAVQAMTADVWSGRGDLSASYCFTSVIYTDLWPGDQQKPKHPVENPVE